jgi:hypothetical protein
MDRMIESMLLFYTVRNLFYAIGNFTYQSPLVHNCDNFTQVLSPYLIKNFSIIKTRNTFWELPVSIFRSIETLIHLKKETRRF